MNPAYAGSAPALASARPARHLKILLVGIAVQLLGRAIDGWWHATHEEFETAGDQLQAHAVLWFGVLTTLAVSAIAARELSGRLQHGYLAVLVTSVAYSIAAIWHFVEHANGADLAAAHVVLGIAWGALLLSALVTALLSRRRVDRASTVTRPDPEGEREAE
jgi:hypothetical protein